MLGGIMGICMIGFGIIWTVIAAQANGMFALFGIIWTGIAVVTTIYNFKNATGKNRYSTYDITDTGEEPDPLNARFGRPQGEEEDGVLADSKFCPYCGAPAKGDFFFCNRCGKKLP